MSTSVFGVEPSAPLMARSVSATSRTSAAESSSSSSRGALSTIASSSSSSPRLSSSKADLLTVATTIDMLEPRSAIIQYTSISALFQRIRYASEESIIVYGISSQEFTKFSKQKEEDSNSICNFHIWLYRADTQCVIFVKPSHEHEGLHRRLDDLFSGDALLMGLGEEYFSVGSAGYEDRDASGNIISEGEGDSCRTPRSKRNKHQYPVLVIEAGWSQTLQNLREKARWWFDKSEGDVKIVLLVKSSPGSNHIRIEKWKLRPAISRQGATNTRAAAVMTPQCVHVIEIA